MSVKPQFPDEQSADGHFVRQEDAFRDRVTADGSSGFPAAAGRYHLYVSLACPWAHRTILVRTLMGLERAIGMTVVDPIRDERGWAFRDVAGASLDPVNGFQYLREAYLKRDPHYAGRVTVAARIRDARRTRRAARGTPLRLRSGARRDRLAYLRNAGPFRCRLRRSFQMQSAAHRRLSPAIGIPPRPLSG